MRTPKDFQITEDAAAILKSWCRSTTLPHGQLMRAKIILQLSEGMTPSAVALAQRTSAKSVHRWRNRFEQEGLEGLHERPRSGRPTVIDKEIVERVLLLTTKHIPKEATHWSIELMAKYAKVTSWQVRQIWKAADLRPHRLKTFKISSDRLAMEGELAKTGFPDVITSPNRVSRLRNSIPPAACLSYNRCEAC